MKHKTVVFASLFLSLPLVAQAATVTMPGYRAVYEVSFVSAAANSGVIGAEGRYVFDIEDACEGYATNERFVVRIARTEDPVVQDYRLSAFEAADGGQYRFSRTVEVNGRTGQQADGKLIVDAEKSSAELDYENADDQSYDGKILTPLAHLREIISTARAEEGRHAAMIFDGDVDSPVFYAVTRISDADPDADIEAEGGETLNGLARWSINSVYYPPKTGGEGEGATPEFTFGATLFENGVLTDMSFDYNDFELKATLSDLEVRKSGC